MKLHPFSYRLLQRLQVAILLVLMLACGQHDSDEKGHAGFRQAKALQQQADSLQQNQQDFEQQQQLVRKSLKMARSIANDSLISEAHLKLGHYYLLQQNDSALFHLRKARNGFRMLRLENRIIRTDAGLVNYFSKRAAYNRATPYIIDAERRLAENRQPNEDHVYYYLQKTIFYHSLGLTDSALITVNKGTALSKRIHSKRYLPNLIASRAVIHSVLGDFRLAIANQRSVLNEFGPYSSDRAVVLTNIGNNYARLRMSDSAEFYYQKALHIYQKINAGATVINKFHNTAANSLLEVDQAASRRHFEQVDEQLLPLPSQFYHRYIRALLAPTTDLQQNGLLDALAFAEKEQLPMNDLKKDCYYELYLIARKKNAFGPALDYFQAYTDLNNIVRGEAMTVKLEQLSLLHNLQEKERRIAAQQQIIAEKSNTIGQQRVNNWLTVSIVVVLAVLLLLLLLNYRKKSRISSLQLSQTRLERELLISAVSPISSQLEVASQLFKTVKKDLGNDSRDQREVREAIDQWLLSYSDQTAIVDASKEHEREFLRKIDFYSELSETEKRIVILIRQGYQSKEISGRLNLALNTVEIYRSKIRKKLNVPQNEQLNQYIHNL